MAKSRLREVRSRKEKAPDTPQQDVSQPAEEQRPVEKKYSGMIGFYHDNYKVLLAIPFILLILAFAQIGYQYSTTGDFLNKGVSLKGGVTITVPYEDTVDLLALEDKLRSEHPGSDIIVKELSSAAGRIGMLIESDITDNDEIEDLRSSIQTELSVPKDQISIEFIGSSLGESFFKETIRAMIIAFLFMGIVVFVYFRTPAPSLAVILAAIMDIVVTLAIVNLLGIKLSTAGIAAFLMLIGYSVDTDMLLTIRVLKRKEGTHFERVLDSMRTGLTMTLTTLAAVAVALMVSESEVLTQIMTILFIGLIVDIIATWLQNVGILRLYLERKGKHE